MTTFPFFTNHMFSFCESTIYGQAPEYVNSVTSLFLTYCGYIGNFRTANTNLMIKILYSALMLNGFVSFCYHWTNFVGFGFMDQISMTLMLIGSYIAIFDEVLYKSYYYTNKKKYSDYLSIVITCVLFYAMIMIASKCLGFSLLFDVLFVLFLVSVTLFVPYSHYISHYRLDNMIEYKYKQAKKGVFAMYIAMIMWIFVEALCDYVWWVKYIPGHAIWHFGTSYGGYYIGQYLIHLYNNRHINKHNIESNA